MSRSEWEAACHHGSTCALTGSAAFFDSIPGRFTVVNGPLWCYFYAMKYVDNENPMASMRFSCTQVGPNSLVYGTEDDLRKGLSGIETYAKPERVFIENNCSVSRPLSSHSGKAADTSREALRSPPPYHIFPTASTF